MRNKLTGNRGNRGLTLTMSAWSSESASGTRKTREGCCAEYRRQMDLDDIPPTGHTARSRWAWCSNRTVRK